MHKFCSFSIWCTLHFILDQTANQEKYGLSVQRQIPHIYIVCQLLPLEYASSTPQYLNIDAACQAWFVIDNNETQWINKNTIYDFQKESSSFCCTISARGGWWKMHKLQYRTTMSLFYQQDLLGFIQSSKIIHSHVLIWFSV